MAERLDKVVLKLAVVFAALAAFASDAASPYSQWTNGIPSDPDLFPIAVWLQSPKNATRYKAAGINLYVGLWKGPTVEQLSALKAAAMPVICSQTKSALAHKDDPTIVAWMHGDEPDNAQEVTDPKTGKRSWGPPVPPAKIVADYEKMRAADPSRPVLLNLGQGVANDEWIGRGSGAKLDDYLTYVKGADIVSFDVYPVAGLEKPNNENYLWYVAKGVERLAQWSDGKKIIWNCIEASSISGKKKPNAKQIKSEVWMSLVSGSRGIIYFVHQFKPTFNEWSLLDDPELLRGVTEINNQIHELAPALNSPSLENVLKVTSSRTNVPVKAAVKKLADVIYVFAVGMRNNSARAIFELNNLPSAAKAEALGENRSVTVRGGKFEDDFQPYAVHLYRLNLP